MLGAVSNLSKMLEQLNVDIVIRVENSTPGHAASGRGDTHLHHREAKIGPGDVIGVVEHVGRKQAGEES